MQSTSISSLPELTGQDWANAIAHATDSNACIQIIASFTGHVDDALLRQAVAYTMRAFPVLGCRFDDAGEAPVWSRVHGADTREWVQVEKAADKDAAIQRFLEDAGAPLEQLIAVRLIYAGEESVLCLRIDHACCDGGGAKAYLQFLCNAYTALAGYPAKPMPVNRNGDRGIAQVFSACGIAGAREAYKPEKNLPLPAVTIPFCTQRSDQTRYARRCISRNGLRPVQAGTTVNDRIVAAYVRCLQKRAQADESNRLPDRLAVNVTVDLRRYLQPDDTPVVCNLSGMEAVAIQIAEDYPATAQNVRAQMDQVKLNQPGLHSAASMEFLVAMTYHKARAFLLQASQKQGSTGVSTPILSNLGQIDDVQMADMRATDVYFATPAFHAPAFMLGCSSYGNILTLTVGYYADERAEKDINDFLEDVAAELCNG